MNFNSRAAIGRAMRSLLLAGAASAVCAVPAWAQSTTSDAGAAEEAPVEQDIVVTGSRIRGVASVGQAVVGVGREELRMSGQTNVTDILREVPQIVNLGADDGHRGVQGAQANTSFASGINIRGIGPTATLTIVNGRRFPVAGGSSQTIDPSVIPTIALERLEVVADGSSAVYGSDAIAGVVNLITRQRFDGVEVRGMVGFADKHKRSNVAAMVGKTWATGNLLLAAERNTRTALRGTERTFHYGDLRNFGGANYNTTSCNPGTLIVGGVNYAIPDMAAPTVADLGPAGTINHCDTRRGINLFPEQDRYSLFASGNQKLIGTVELFTENYYSRRDFEQMGYNFTPQAVLSASVPRTNAFYLNPTGGTGAVTVNYMMPEEFGNAINDGHAYSWQTVWGTRFELPASWRGSAYGSFGKTRNLVNTRNTVDPVRVLTALASSDPQSALDVFGKRTTAATYDYIRGSNVATTENSLRVFGAQADGPLFALRGGTVRLAVGAESRRETFAQWALRFPSPQADNRVDSNRVVNSAYAELFVPLFSADNAVGGVQRLDLSFAGRVDDYSDVGQTINPKIGVSWVPVSNVTLRGSYGTSFRAPSLIEADPSGTVVQRTLADPKSPTGSSIGMLYYGGNPTLSPEKSTTWSLGIDYGRQGAGGLFASVTYFDLIYDNQIFDLFGAQSTALQNEALFASQITRNPTMDQINTILNAGYRVSGTINPSVITFIMDGRRQNLGITKAAGIDYQIAYGFDGDHGRLELASDGTYFTRFDIAQAPGAPLRDVRNLIDNSPKFRARAHLGWSSAGTSIRLTLNHLNAYTNDLVRPVERVEAYDTFDVRGTHKFGGDNPLTLSVAIQNLFDRDPPFVNIAGGFDPQNASALGRLVTFSATKAF